MIIRDPVHGDMSFNESERRVMDTRQMQRLRGVRQTGSAYLVYPGCVHTRFEHSLGTTAMSRRVLEVLRRGGAQIDPEQADVVALLIALFSGGTLSSCPDACDADDDGNLTIIDAIYELNSLFGGGSPMPPPFECGPDPTPDLLGCTAVGNCP